MCHPSQLMTSEVAAAGEERPGGHRCLHPGSDGLCRSHIVPQLIDQDWSHGLNPTAREAGTCKGETWNNGKALKPQV